MEISRVSIGSLDQHLNEKILVEGFVYEVKDHGGIIIADIYDESGYVKAVIGPDNVYVYKTAQEIGKGFYVGICGKAKNAPHSVAVNDSDRVEIDVEKIIILGKGNKKII